MTDNPQVAAAQRRNAEARRSAERQRQQTQAEAQRALAEREKATAEASRIRAEADATAARQRAAEAQAAADQRRLQTEARIRAQDEERAHQRKRDEEKRADELAGRSPLAKYTGLATTAAAIGGGLLYGAHKAKKIDAGHTAFVKLAAPQVTALGTRAETLMRPNKAGTIPVVARNRLAGIVQTADKMGLTRARGPLGLVGAGILLSEGLAARYLAGSMPGEAAQEATRQLGTALTIAAGAQLGVRGLQRVNPKALPPARPLASIQAARLIVNTAPRAAAVNTVAAARRAMGAAQRATSTAGMVRNGVLGAVGQANLAVAKRVAIRAGAVGAIAAVGFAVANTEPGRKLTQWVTGHWRKNADGSASYVAPHARRIG